MPLTMKVTNAGRAALVNASNTGTTPVTIAEIGLSETAVVASATATSLPGEFKRIAGVAGDVVAADTIHVNVTDGGSDTYALRAFALYLGDGTLFAIYGQPEPFLEKTAQSIAAISIDAIFADIDAALLTFGDTNFLNPPATTERAGVVELLTSVEAIAGADTDRAATAKAVKDAVTAWLNARFGANNSGIWHPGNDGAGSGLDADLLDGRQASDFLLATAYTPAVILAKLLSVDGAGSGLDADLLDGKQSTAFLLAASYTAADILAKLLTVDGAGSGVDSDLLDGQQGSFYTNIAARLGYTPANRAGDTFSGDIEVIKSPGDASVVANCLGVVRAFLSAQNDGNVVFYTQRPGSEAAVWRISSNSGPFVFNVPVVIQGGTSWHAGNDGAGSGLDADTLDGFHASDFLRDIGSSQSTNGYLRLSNGMLLQWVNVSCSASGTSSFSWPIAFPNTVFAAVPGGRQGLGYSGSYSAYLSNITTAGGKAYGNNGGGSSSTVCIIAIGN